VNRFILALGAFACVDQASIKKIMEHKSAQFIAAFKARDYAWFDKNSTADYTETSHGRVFKKAAALGQMKMMLTACKSIDVITEKMTGIKMQGKNVMVTSTTHFIGSLQGPSGKSAKIEDTAVQQELWVPTGSDYKIKSTVALSDNTLINGKPFKGAM
jgi:hypothetical protein